MDYRSHLRSSEWRSLKAKLLKSNQTASCYVCGEPGKRLDGHHMTYERLGSERTNDVRLVCRPCHDEVHLFAAGLKTSDKYAYAARRLRGKRIGLFYKNRERVKHAGSEG